MTINTNPSTQFAPGQRKRVLNDQRFSELLDSMEKKGTIFVKIVDKKHYYALHPIAVGIFEMQVERMSPNFFLGIHKYFYPWFGLEFFTSKLPQLRTIPVEKSLPVDQLNIATYDQIRKLIEDADGRLGVARCICKVGKDLLDAPCKLTERRDLCLVLNENAESWLRNGWAKPLTKDEAFDLLAKNEKDGLVLSVSNAKIPYFVCSCCRCCCGVLEALNMMPRPVDFMESNYYAVLDSEKCTGCGLCVRRCQMAAITSKESDTGETPPTIDLDRCIGCGLCVTTCKKGAIHMKKKYLPTIPPEDMDDLNEILMENKKGYSSKLVTMAKAVVGRKVGN